MTITDILNRITFYTSLDTNAYPNTDRLLAINKWYDNLHSIILESQDEWDFDDSNHSDLPIARTNLTITNSYALPETIYRLNGIYINYGSGFIKANPIDLNESGFSEEEISERANVASPLYMIIGNTCKIFPTPTQEVDKGFKVVYERAVEHFTTSDITTGTKEPGFDRLFHDYIPLGASLDAGVKFNLINKADLKNLIDETETRIRKYYGRKTKDRKFQFTNFIEDYE